MNDTNVYIGDYKALEISFPQKQNKRKNGDICQEIMTKNISAFEVFLVHS